MVQLKEIINSIFNSKTYLVQYEQSHVYLIDCGDIEPIVKWCKENEKVIKGVFITHSHFDHIYGLNELIDYNPNCVVYVSRESKEALYSDRLNFSLYHEKSFIFLGDHVRLLEDGDKVELWKDLYLEVIATPGHAKGCLCYKIGHYLFTGDAYIPGIKTVTALRGGSKEDNEKSLAKIRSLLSADTVVCAGHAIK